MIIHSDDQDRNLKIGIDLGGTKIEILLMSKDKILYRYREPTLRGRYEDIVDQLAALIRTLEATSLYQDLLQGSKPATIGIGIPGSISPVTGLVRNANTTELNGRSLKHDLELAIDRQLSITNDANCFALSEALEGVGRAAKTVFGVIIGTGVGGGIVINKELLIGSNGIAGEWGHNPLPWLTEADFPLPDCYCGKKGCIETFLSGSGLVASYLAGSIESMMEIDAKSVVEKAVAGEKTALDAIDLYADRLARSLAHICNILDPEVIVLGGGLSNIDLLYDLVPKYIEEYVFADQIEVQIVRPEFGDSSGVRGAAWLGC